MLFLILLCSLIPFVTTADVEEEFSLPKSRLECYHYIHDTLLGECNAGNMESSVYESLGLVEREYKLSEYTAHRDRHLGEEIEYRLRKASNLTFREQIQQLKELNRGLENEVDFYIAFEVKKTIVYLGAALFQSQYKQECFEQKKCEVPIPNWQALVILEEYETIIRRLLDDFGSETKQSLQEITYVFENSKVLDLDFNRNSIHRKYQQWLNKCQENIQEASTETTSDYQWGKEDQQNEGQFKYQNIFPS